MQSISSWSYLLIYFEVDVDEEVMQTETCILNVLAFAIFILKMELEMV